MKRNGGIWLVIGCILILGIVITLFTSNFITNKEYELTEAEAGTEETSVLLSEETLLEADRALPAAPASETGSSSVPGEEPASDDSAADAPAMQMAMGVPVPDSAEEAPLEEAEAAEDDNGPVQYIEISPLDANGSSVYADTGDGGQEYRDRLLELDAQVKKIRESSTDSTTYAMKNIVEKELRLWDVELNSVYGAIIDRLGQEDKTALVQEEKEWMKERDAKAAEAAKRYSGGTLEGVEYTASLAESTRQRTYDLVDEYIDVLGRKK